VTDGKTLPLGQVELPVTFGGRDNFCTESITFDRAHFDFSCNTILGRPALAKFMAAVHYACNTLKIPGPSGVISIKAYVKRSVNCAERLYEAVATTSSDDVERPKASAPPSTKQRLSPDSSTLVEEIISAGTEPGDK
jgi:hypothetical protein